MQLALIKATTSLALLPDNNTQSLFALSPSSPFSVDATNMQQSPEKKPEPDPAGVLAGALTGFLADSDEEGGLSPELPIEEELVEKVMHELYEEITGQNDFTQVPAALPQPPTSPAWVTKNGKNGSCGASVSETASTVMAGVHFTCRAGEMSGPSPLSLDGEGSGNAGEAGGGNGAEIDEEWLEKALCWVPLMEGLGMQ